MSYASMFLIESSSPCLFSLASASTTSIERLAPNLDMTLRNKPGLRSPTVRIVVVIDRKRHLQRQNLQGQAVRAHHARALGHGSREAQGGRGQGENPDRKRNAHRRILVTRRTQGKQETKADGGIAVLHRSGLQGRRGNRGFEKHLKWADSIREKQTSPFRYRGLVGTEGLGPPTLSV